MRWPDAQSLWLAKELRKLQATLSQDFLAFTRQFDDVWYATSAGSPKSLRGRKSATFRAGTNSLSVSGRVLSPLPLSRGEVARVFFARVSISDQHQPLQIVQEIASRY